MKPMRFFGGWVASVLVVLAVGAAGALGQVKTPLEAKAKGAVAAKKGSSAPKAPANKPPAKKVASKRPAPRGESDKLSSEQIAERKARAQSAHAAHAAWVKLEGDLAGAKSAVGKKQAAAQQAAARAKDAKDAAKRAPDNKGLVRRAAVAEEAAAKAAAEQAAGEKQVAERAKAAKAAFADSLAAHNNALGGLKALPRDQWSHENARHLLFRAGFGGAAKEVDELHALGVHGAVDRMVNYHKRPEPNLPFDVRPPERPAAYERYLGNPERRELQDERQRRERAQQARLRQWWLQRMAETERPLQEKLTLFWHDHFAVNYKEFYFTHLLANQNRLFREFAGDSYSALLHGIVHDAAMIRYLDNHRNFKGSGNENLGREILELFSMGAGHGYTEEDLREASRALTGYNYDNWTGQFRFLATRHDETNKRIFGRTGAFGGDELVDAILQQPATARYIALKLYKFFVHDEPETATIDTLAGVLRENDYELAPLLTNLFLSDDFYSQKAKGAHIKSPAELMVGTIRVLGIGQVDYVALDGAVQNMGLVLFEPPNVAGWEEGKTWVDANRILIRYNAVANLVEQRGVDVLGLVESAGCHTAADVVDYFAKSCLLTPLNESKRKELIDFLGVLPPPAQWSSQRDQLNSKLRALLVTLMSTPEYQMS